MESTTKKIRKITSKGQITLPALWRKKIKVNQVLLKTKGDSIEISPLYLSEQMKPNEYTVFDALRDNKGKGLRAADLLKILKKIDR